MQNLGVERTNCVFIEIKKKAMHEWICAFQICVGEELIVLIFFSVIKALGSILNIPFLPQDHKDISIV